MSEPLHLKNVHTLRDGEEKPPELPKKVEWRLISGTHGAQVVMAERLQTGFVNYAVQRATKPANAKLP